MGFLADRASALTSYTSNKIEDMKNNVNRLIALGLKRASAVELESLVDRWSRCSGPEWTVSRLKQIKMALVNYAAGRPIVLSWVRLNKSGLPSGVLSHLFRMSRQSDKGLFISVNSLMIYSQFISNKMTDKQREKFFGSMESTEARGLDAKSTRSYKLVPKIRPNLRKGLPWTNALLSESVFQPGQDGKSYPETDTFQSLLFAACSKPIMSLEMDYERIFREVIPTELFDDLSYLAWKGQIPRYSPMDMCVGKISYIQEPGMKLRAVANPNRVLQSVLEPLKEVLGEVLSFLPNDSTFDQEQGVQWVKDQLLSGKTMHSIDLSDATNLFPLAYTEDVLLRRFPISETAEGRYRSLVEIFIKTSRSPWFSKESDGTVRIHKFTRGQPLGLGPSFFAFALSHHCLVMDLCRDLGLIEPYPYRILGDDIVIANNLLSSVYREKLEEIGCKISHEKSMTSDIMAEFAGKIITKSVIVPQFKWRDLDDSNFVDFCRNVGPKSVSLLSRRQADIINLLGEVPSLIGGLGWNPHGLPIEHRLTPFALFLLNKNPEVYLPYRRVDRPLKEFMNSFVSRVRTLGITANRYAVTLIPTRDDEAKAWGTHAFWKLFRLAENSKQPFKVQYQFPSDEKDEIADLFFNVFGDLFSPIYREDGDPTEDLVATPWFDIVRYFRRTAYQRDQLH